MLPAGGGAMFIHDLMVVFRASRSGGWDVQPFLNKAMLLGRFPNARRWGGYRVGLCTACPAGGRGYAPRSLGRSLIYHFPAAGAATL